MKNETAYTVIIHPAEEGGYWTQVPALPGAGSQGETVEKALANTKEAIELYIESLRADSQPVPKDEGVIVHKVTVAA